MTLAFTLCSVNYLAQAKTLAESMAHFSPNIKFVVGLVDKLDNKAIDPEKLGDIELIEVHKIGIENFASMIKRYNITELNTAVKPYFIDYFWENHPEVQKVFYFDPDIIVYQPLTDLEAHLEHSDFVVTPHTLSSYKDQLWQNEEDLCNSGIFNLGFIGLKRSKNAIEFTQWWMKKLEKECLIDLKNGLFVDQHWVDFLLIYWSNVHIERAKGYNVAYWNLHERPIQSQNDQWMIENEPLVFFHYSGYLPSKAEVVSKYQNRIQFEGRPDIVPLFKHYHNRLIENHQEYFEKFPCDYLKITKPERLVRVRKYMRMPFEAVANFLSQ